jgi:hypothetical protein
MRCNAAVPYPLIVMAGLDPVIHQKRKLDGRLKGGHDGIGWI